MPAQAPALLRVLLDSLLPPKEGDTNLGDSGEKGGEARRKTLERAWCFELASAVLALLVEHVRSPYSAELWLELHYGVGTATARHRVSLGAPADNSADGGLEREGANCAAVRHTVDLLSQAVGHMGGILLREEAIGVKQAALLAEVLAELTSPDLFWHSGTSAGCRRAVVVLLSVSLCGLHKHQRLVKAMPRVIRATVAAPLSESEPETAVLAEGGVDTHPALALSRSLLGGVGSERTTNKPPPMRVTRAVALRPLLEACAGPLSARADVALEILTRVIHGTGVGLVFVGDSAIPTWGGGRARAEDSSDGEGDGQNEDEGLGALVTVTGVASAGGLPIGMAAGKKVSSSANWF